MFHWDNVEFCLHCYKQTFCGPNCAGKWFIWYIVNRYICIWDLTRHCNQQPTGIFVLQRRLTLNQFQRDKIVRELSFHSFVVATWGGFVSPSWSVGCPWWEASEDPVFQFTVYDAHHIYGLWSIAQKSSVWRHSVPPSPRPSMIPSWFLIQAPSVGPHLLTLWTTWIARSYPARKQNGKIVCEIATDDDCKEW